jgi:hypothetical protein
MLWRSSVKSYQLALGTVLIVVALVGLRALLFAVGFEGMPPSVLASSIVGGGVFVMGLVIAGTLSDYRDAERAPTDLAAGLYASCARPSRYGGSGASPTCHACGTGW